MKAIMISIKPQWVSKILNGEKTIEIRKTMPKCKLPVKVYIYCTKGNKNTSLVNVIQYGKSQGFYNLPNDILWRYDDFAYRGTNILNGKVVACFTLNEVDKIEICDPDILINGKQCYQPHLEQSSRLKISEIMEYIGYGNDHDGWGKDWSAGYAWHIDDLQIYDTPREVGEFYRLYDYKNSFSILRLTRPPQSWCHCEELEEEDVKNS